MPHGESWFSLISGYAHWLSDAQASHGPTWIAHGDLSIQHILHWIFLIVVLLVVGLVVSIFQAATQINEATLTFVPKILAAVAVLAVAGPWMLTTLVEYLQRTLQAIPTVVG